MKTLQLNKGTRLVLQTVFVLIGLGALAFMLWEPHLEGRNAHATLTQIYFNDPFLAFAYIASIPFFMVLVQAFKMLRGAAAATAFRTIKLCAIALIVFGVTAEIFIMLNTSDDRAGGVVMGLLIIIASFVVATLAAKFEKNFAGN
jgi:hypothetical protein